VLGLTSNTLMVLLSSARDLGSGGALIKLLSAANDSRNDTIEY
jgi:hypothetical protein